MRATHRLQALLRLRQGALFPLPSPGACRPPDLLGRPWPILLYVTPSALKCVQCGHLHQLPMIRQLIIVLKNLGYLLIFLKFPLL